MTIDDKIDAMLRKIASDQRMSYKEVVNRALEQGLLSLEAQKARPKYRVNVKAYGFRAGVDQEKLNQLIDELEAEE